MAKLSDLIKKPVALTTQEQKTTTVEASPSAVAVVVEPVAALPPKPTPATGSSLFKGLKIGVSNANASQVPMQAMDKNTIDNANANASVQPKQEDTKLAAVSQNNSTIKSAEPRMDLLPSGLPDTLPPELVVSFRESIQILHDCFDQPQLITDATRNILHKMAEHPEFQKLLLPQDCGLMVRALRESYNMVASSKIVNKTKRAESKSKSAQFEAAFDAISFDDLGNLEV